MAADIISHTPSLTTLPNELLDAVANYLDKPSLCELALACKGTTRSSTDALYKEYVNHDPPSKAPFALFLGTICKRPDLAAKVKEVDIRGCRSEFEVATGAPWKGLVINKNQKAAKKQGGSSQKSPPVSVTFTLFVEAAVEAKLIAKRESYPVPALKTNAKWYTTMKAERDFIRLLGHGVEDAHVLLMLALLPNIRVLRIDGLTPYPTLDMHHFLQRSPTALRTLRLLALHGSFTAASEPVGWNTLEILDLLPSLRALVLENMIVDKQPTTQAPIPSTDLRGVSLRNVGISTTTLQNLLVNQEITWFRYLPNVPETTCVPITRLCTTDFANCLKKSRLSLRELEVFPTASSTQTAFRSFKSLTHLEIPQSDFLPLPPTEADPEAIINELRGQVPRSLRTLSLRGLICDAQLKIILEQLVQLKLQGELPNLQSVRLNFYRLMPRIVGFAREWVAVPDPGARMREEHGGPFDSAGLRLEIEQTD